MRILKALTVMLTVCVLVLSCAPFCVAVSSYSSSDKFIYTVNGSYATITGYNGVAVGTIEIPETIDGYTVTTIGKGAFMDSVKLVGVILPDSVTVLEDEAFGECSLLESVTFSKNLETVGKFTFANCYSLKSIKLPESLKKIDKGAFVACTGLTMVAIPKNVESVGEGAFARCTALYNLTVFEGVKRIESFAFNSCVKLKNITLANSIEYIGCSAFDNTEYCNNPNYDGNGALYIDNHLVDLKDKTYGVFEVRDGTRSIGACAFVCNPEVEYILVPETLKGVADIAFYGCDQLKKVHGKQQGFDWSTVTVGVYNSALDSVKAYYSGDVNENGTLETQDAVYLMYYVLFGDENYPVYGNCNFDNVGMVDGDDAVYLLYHILYGDEYKLFPKMPEWNNEDIKGEITDDDDDYTDWAPTYPDGNITPDDENGIFGDPEAPDENYSGWVPIL